MEVRESRPRVSTGVYRSLEGTDHEPPLGSSPSHNDPLGSDEVGPRRNSEKGRGQREGRRRLYTRQSSRVNL